MPGKWDFIRAGQRHARGRRQSEQRGQYTIPPSRLSGEAVEVCHAFVQGTTKPTSTVRAAVILLGSQCSLPILQRQGIAPSRGGAANGQARGCLEHDLSESKRWSAECRPSLDRPTLSRAVRRRPYFPGLASYHVDRKTSEANAGGVYNRPGWETRHGTGSMPGYCEQVRPSETRNASQFPGEANDGR